MKKHMSLNHRRWLKFAHLFFASLWGGGAVTMVMVFCIIHPATAAEQVELSKVFIFMDFIIVGPGAAGCLATGIIYSVYGNYRFFKFKWIMCKYIINIVFILYGSLVFLPFTHKQYLYYSSLPANLPVPAESSAMNIFCTAQNFCTIIMFIIVVYLSVFKPFSKKRVFDIIK